jgi:hypothetical protein
MAKVGMKILDHGEQLPIFLKTLGQYPIVLEIPWLRLHDVVVHYASNDDMFGLQNWTTHSHEAPVTVQGVTVEPLEPAYPVARGIFDIQI